VLFLVPPPPQPRSQGPKRTIAVIPNHQVG
jgi:hypothetical protein